MHIDLESLVSEYGHLGAEALLKAMAQLFSKELVLASSLGAEDQVLTDMLLKINPNACVFVLDTGRLHEETYEVMTMSRAKYGMTYELYFPDAQQVENLVRTKGPHSFYESIENRKECCRIRKVEPLRRALSGAKAWITGLRQSQSATRQALQTLEWDEAHGLIKINPLAAWTEDMVWDYIRTHDVPVNRLHKQGYPSIGCAPCTRAIKPGEDIRSGRWWWENPDSKECGLHLK